MTAEAKASILARVLDWLRAGYPQGVPREDYVALLAVLHRKLTDDEVRQIVRELTADRTRDHPDDAIDPEEIETAISDLAKETPGDEDIGRVRSRLEAGGWQLAEPSES
ncbi:DUF3349 domain-containing protein [Antrihabitans cavernicola]|uniref:DUF3349 domain-containing protein n=1 Tax=Antrihabitans cavernicola TaxID=2495913 RepID=UPI001F419A7D|nr:DUF3349 domain-containing protein [Spelaeibacter cavernicola]